ncbi:MAG TPA: hypothetical protein VFQ57_05410 [Sphingomonas sp.]|jgi:energy-converting hydrogenase Eha subunit E|nr:hypothetical protein [Sphingomonas sp.]
MNTIYDVATVAAFAALIVLFLHRSDQAQPPRDALWHYLVVAVGCAGVNWLGNAGHHLAAILTAIAMTVFVAIVLRPFTTRDR